MGRGEEGRKGRGGREGNEGVHLTHFAFRTLAALRKADVTTHESSIPAQDRVVHIFTKSMIMARRCDKSPINRKIFIFVSNVRYFRIKTKSNTSTLTHPLDVACAVAYGNSRRSHLISKNKQLTRIPLSRVTSRSSDWRQFRLLMIFTARSYRLSVRLSVRLWRCGTVGVYAELVRK